MPSLNAWLEITIPIPVWMLPVLALLATALGIGGTILARRALRRRQAYQELRARAEAWRSAQEAYRHFIYNISHEVSNPLQSIQTNLDNMARSLPQDGRWQRYHTPIAAELQRLSGLTEKLRLLSHLETPDTPTIREPVNVKGVVESVTMALYETAEARQVRLRYVGPDRPARVLGDRDELHQVLMNLVDNGIKYSKPGGEVIVSVQEEDDRLRVRVSDEGLGIAEEDLPHIFDTAYRAPDARSFREKGSGLGLAIVKRIVERHGGEIRVQSWPGEGTTFTFELPL
jgi:signal transduction histidine kinase